MRFDATAFVSEGMASVGMASQYWDTVGKAPNGQVVVPCGYADPTYLHSPYAAGKQ